MQNFETICRDCVIDYRGCIKYRIKNISSNPIFLKKGMSVYQMVVHSVNTDPLIKKTINVNETKRKDMGFGKSTLQASQSNINTTEVEPDDESETLHRNKMLITLYEQLAQIEEQCKND